MFRGITRLFRFKLRVTNLHLELREGIARDEVSVLIGDWSIIDKKANSKTVGKVLSGLTRREARKALRWWRRFGE